MTATHIRKRAVFAPKNRSKIVNRIFGSQPPEDRYHCVRRNGNNFRTRTRLVRTRGRAIIYIILSENSPPEAPSMPLLASNTSCEKLLKGGLFVSRRLFERIEGPEENEGAPPIFVLELSTEDVSYSAHTRTTDGRSHTGEAPPPPPSLTLTPLPSPPRHACASRPYTPSPPSSPVVLCVCCAGCTVPSRTWFFGIRKKRSRQKEEVTHVRSPLPPPQHT